MLIHERLISYACLKTGVEVNKEVSSLKFVCSTYGEHWDNNCEKVTTSNLEEFLENRSNEKLLKSWSVVPGYECENFDTSNLFSSLGVPGLNNIVLGYLPIFWEGNMYGFDGVTWNRLVDRSSVVIVLDDSSKDICHRIVTMSRELNLIVFFETQWYVEDNLSLETNRLIVFPSNINPYNVNPFFLPNILINRLSHKSCTSRYTMFSFVDKTVI